MGKLNAGILGGYSGKVGKTAGYRMNGKNIVRQCRKKGSSVNTYDIASYQLYVDKITTFFNNLSATIRNAWAYYPSSKSTAINNFVKFHLKYCFPDNKYGSSVFCLLPYNMLWIPNFTIHPLSSGTQVQFRFVTNSILRSWANPVSVTAIFSQTLTTSGGTVINSDIRSYTSAITVTNALWADITYYLILVFKDTVTNSIIFYLILPCKSYADVNFKAIYS